SRPRFPISGRYSLGSRSYSDAIASTRTRVKTNDFAAQASNCHMLSSTNQHHQTCFRPEGENMEIDRRRFIRTTGEAITVGAATLAFRGRVLGANDRVRIAICGTRGRGKDHIRGFAKVPGGEIAALCDVDERVLGQRLKDVEDLGKPRPKSYVDIRKLLEDKEIDAITIATPNHWHSLMGIWACQAGKDVYVEKPCSHDPFEGRQLVRAVKKYNRICQHGSQS